MVNVSDHAEGHPVEVAVNLNTTFPGAKDVTTPVLGWMVAIVVLLLSHTPPVVGDNVVLPPTHMFVGPVKVTVVVAVTVTGNVGADGQPPVGVKVNVAVPALKPVTTPVVGLTLAIVSALLVQVPPEDGDKVVVPSIQIVFDPVMLTAGLAFTVIGFVGEDKHPVAVSLNLNVALP